MRVIFMLDDEQLRQIEAKLEDISKLPTAEQARRQCLIEALRRKRTELLRYRSRAGREPKSVAYAT